ncbi:unnamed protein product, partial [Brassica rapa]
VEVSRLLAHFQIGAEVEILSTDDEIWYPGKVVDLKLCEGLEELTVEYTTLFADQHRLQKLQDTITADKIRPATPTNLRIHREWKDGVWKMADKSDRNPALTVIPEIIPAVDPFSTPAEHKLSRLQNWMTLKPGMHETNSFESLIDCWSLSINDNKIRKSFFQSMENAKKGP